MSPRSSKPLRVNHMVQHAFHDPVAVRRAAALLACQPHVALVVRLARVDHAAAHLLHRGRRLGEAVVVSSNSLEKLKKVDIRLRR